MARKRNATLLTGVIEVIFVLLIMAGLFMVIVDGLQAYEAYSSQFWPITSGEITKSRVRIRGNASGARTYIPNIEYAYAVDPSDDTSELFNGERLTVDRPPAFENRALAEAKIEQYPLGSAIDVYYNPDRPHKSILEPGFSSAKLINPLIGLLFLVLAFGLKIYERLQS